MAKVTVLRLGHRYARDKRISTHIALVARAFGAEKVVFDALDDEIATSVGKICEQWGGRLAIESASSWKAYIEGFDGDRIHLTMYGINVNDCIDEISSSKKDKLVIVGGQKVPSEVYSLVDYNVAVGSQPHSEVAALAVFLDRLFMGKELERDFSGKKRIIPQACGKKVVEERGR